MESKVSEAVYKRGDIVSRTQVSEMLAVPMMDVSVGLCMVKPSGKSKFGARMFDIEIALKAMIQYYRRQFECNRELYRDRHMELYHDYALKYRTRMERAAALLDGLAEEEAQNGE